MLFRRFYIPFCTIKVLYICNTKLLNFLSIFILILLSNILQHNSNVATLYLQKTLRCSAQLQGLTQTTKNFSQLRESFQSFVHVKYQSLRNSLKNIFLLTMNVFIVACLVSTASNVPSFGPGACFIQVDTITFTEYAIVHALVRVLSIEFFCQRFIRSL